MGYANWVYHHFHVSIFPIEKKNLNQKKNREKKRIYITSVYQLRKVNNKSNCYLCKDPLLQDKFRSKINIKCQQYGLNYWNFSLIPPLYNTDFMIFHITTSKYSNYRWTMRVVGVHSSKLQIIRIISHRKYKIKIM